MRYILWGLLAIVGIVLVAFFHYVLPSRDVVRVVGTEVRLVEQSRTDQQGNAVPFQDDVFYIKTVEPDGEPRVYRNEDNWWYFKFDSGNLDTEASNYVSTAADPKWVVVNHYGWRIPIMSMYPNATSIRAATGPDESLTPWFNIIFFVTLVVVLLILRRIVLIFRRRHVDPVLDSIDQEIDEQTGWLKRQWKKIIG